MFLQTFAILSLTLSEHIHALCVQNDNEMYLLVFSERLVVNESVSDLFFLLGDSPAYEFYMPTFRSTLFHFIGGVNRKNNRDEFVGAFIQEKVSLNPLAPELFF